MKTARMVMKTNPFVAMNFDKRDVIAGRLALIAIIGTLVGATGLTFQLDTTSLAFVFFIWLGVVPLLAYGILRQMKTRSGRLVRLLQRVIFGLQAIGALVGGLMILVYTIFGTVMVITGTLR
jgi:hypothetical protein